MPDRRRPLYSPEERAIIDVHKEEYLNAASALEKKQLAQNKIFPAIFNHWERKGIDLSDPQPRMKVCMVGIGGSALIAKLSGVKGTCIVDAEQLAISYILQDTIRYLDH